MVRQTAFHALCGAPVALDLRWAGRGIGGDVQGLLRSLGRELEDAPRGGAARHQPA
jgi:hypothetical protein